MASFWFCNRISGRSAHNIAPSLFAKTTRKNITVQKALVGNTWISHISPLASSIEIKEYVELWEAISSVQLNCGAKDEIIWCWPTNGEYTTRSAYLIQFLGSFSRLKLIPIWKAKVEQKCRFFAWNPNNKQPSPKRLESGPIMQAV